MEQQIIDIVFTALGTYGLATLVTDYSGPFNLFVYLRKKGVPDCNVCVATWLLLPVLLLVMAGLGVPLAALGLMMILARSV